VLHPEGRSSSLFLFGKERNSMTIEIGLIMTALSVVIAFLGFRLNNMGYQLNKAKKIKNDSEESTEMRVELRHIREGVNNILIDIKANEKQMVTLGERVTRVEESSKQAHRRIDNLEKEGN
jgi:uncharacterized coiled-coil DUF342 family protein